MEGNSSGGGGNDVELLCKTLQVEHKLFYFDLKENPRGRYLKISEKTSATRSTIIVPFNGISWFLDLFNYYVNSDDQDVFSKELQLDTKVFYFDVGENRRGRFLKVTLLYLEALLLLCFVANRKYICIHCFLARFH
ncbi:Adenylosuccinate synthetase 1, chloroplastic [Datura stramonium]|uniref:Adenylosuccinate synthetase 1, chloroplastic n=1 Tax=Datura stramonium TaxID=4076 RepID=A0ABS8Y5Q8_DATST|nr:Adenylosuccinate synthetase 1, chloroplastic [Datura stramonium]